MAQARRPWVVAALAALLGTVCLSGGSSLAAEVAADAVETDDEDEVESGFELPSDRQQERLLDRAGRLVEAGDWSDAATVLDEILAADRDFFCRQRRGGNAPGRGTRSSIKAEAARLIATLPPPGRQAYDLQFRARAEKLFAEAIAEQDFAKTLAVARRWFATPAGQRAILLAAVDALEANQPLAAVHWLERLEKSEAGPSATLEVMRAMALDRAGDAAAAAAVLDRARAASRGVVRIAGKEVTLSYPAGRGLEWLRELAGPAGRRPGGLEWWQPRGDECRNAVVPASRPLLVPRYRVPLVRHPEEAAALEGLRREYGDRGAAGFSASIPLAVDGTILARAPLGLLAIDFATGKRLWLQGGGRGGPLAGGPHREHLARTFDDLTGGGMASDGRLVFAVEVHPDVLAARVDDEALALAQGRPAWRGGNTLSAYEVRGGRLVWRLPAADAGGVLAAGGLGSSTWFAGAPLVVDDRLHALVEERGELRLDVLQAADGRRIWSQPLAEIDDQHTVREPTATVRRLAGATPALGEGVLVCPLGTGVVVAVDLANRSLLWAYDYATHPRIAAGGVNGPRLRAFMGGVRLEQPDADGGRRHAGWCDGGPVIAEGRVLLGPPDSDELHCLDVRTGVVRWRQPRAGRLHVAGVVAGRVLVVGPDRAESLDLATGRQVWQRPFGPGVVLSGRGILTAERLFLPLDTPEVVEIDLADGSVAGRSPSRGGAVPGNLVAYRGEVISLGVDAVDVFHQAAALATRIETAAREPAGAWPAAVWAAHLRLDGGDTAAGLAALRDALARDPRHSPDALAAAVAHVVRRDFAVGMPLWRECLPGVGLTPAARGVLRAVVDAALASQRPEVAWDAWRELFERSLSAPAEAVGDTGDPRSRVTDHRWLRGRLERLWGLAGESLRAGIADQLEQAVAAAGGRADAAARRRHLAAIVAAVGDPPAGGRARARLADELVPTADEAAEDGLVTRSLAVQRDMLLLELARAGDAPQRSAARAAIAELRDHLAAGGPSADAADAAAAWPLGRVETRRATAGRAAADGNRSRLLPLPLEETASSFLPGLSVAWDLQHSQTVILDRFGRRLGDGPPVHAGVRFGLPVLDHTGVSVATLGRIVYLRTGGEITALEVGGQGIRRLWTAGAGAGAGPDGRLRGPAALAPRNGPVVLGARVVEAGAAAGVAWGRPVAAGIPVWRGGTLRVLDPVTGDTLWERSRLAAATDLVNDDRVVCVGSLDGRRSRVFSMADGRFLHEIDLPTRHDRLLTQGSRVLVVAATDGDSEAGIATTVRLDVVDVADGSAVPVGEFSGSSRGHAFGAGRFAVLDREGNLALIDVDARPAVARVRLPEMPQSFDQFVVVPWEDRLLVCVGSRPAGDADAADDLAIAPLQQMLISGPGATVSNFTVWAVDGRSGEPIWQAPATVERHCLLSGQPAGLPVLVFARQIQRQHDRSRLFLSVLCLDKRTGHAVFEDDRIPAQPHLLLGCDLVGDPDRRTITIREHGGDPQRVTLTFTGEPAPPRPPYRAGRPIQPEGLLRGLNRLIQGAIAPRRGD